MSQYLLEHAVKTTLKSKLPSLKPGYTVRVLQKIKEGEKVRTQVFEGLVIRISAGSGVNKTFTVRKVVQGVGVEKLFPLHSPFIEKIDVVKKGKVRRSKLYFMRDLEGKSTRLRDDIVREEHVAEEPVVEEAPKAEEPKMEEKEEKGKEEEKV